MNRKKYIKPNITIYKAEQESPLCSGTGTKPEIPVKMLNGIQCDAVQNSLKTDRIWIGSEDINKGNPVINDAKGDNLWDEWE